MAATWARHSWHRWMPSPAVAQSRQTVRRQTTQMPMASRSGCQVQRPGAV